MVAKETVEAERRVVFLLAIVVEGEEDGEKEKLEKEDEKEEVWEAEEKEDGEEKVEKEEEEEKNVKR